MDCSYIKEYWRTRDNNISYCPTRANRLCLQSIDDKIWHLIFPDKCYEMTGKELNDIAERHDITFAKYISIDGNYGYIFKCGENIDTKEFSPHGECSAGGLYFTLERMVENYYKVKSFIVEITVDDDARVWIEDGKMKADKINIVSKITYEG